MLAPRGTMGHLLGPGQELRVGVGEGREKPGQGGRLARNLLGKAWGMQACWPAPLGFLLASVAHSPRGKAEGTGAAGRGGPGHLGP